MVLRFPPRLVDQPIVCNLVRRYDLEFNILRAAVTPREEGLLVLAVKGTETACDEGMKYLEDVGVKVQPLSQEIVRSETRCTHCGACVAVCPSGALALDAESRKVIFDNEKCIACEFCVRACPTRAMEVHFWEEPNRWAGEHE
jgi:ferredoxin